MGYLSILCPKANSSQEMFVVANRRGEVSAELNRSIAGVPPEDYMVIVFDLGSDVLPDLSNDVIIQRSAGERENINVVQPGNNEGESCTCRNS